MNSGSPSPLKINGAENGIRTHDLRITNALLYQLSYLGINTTNFS